MLGGGTGVELALALNRGGGSDEDVEVDGMGTEAEVDSPLLSVPAPAANSAPTSMPMSSAPFPPKLNPSFPIASF